VSATNVVVAHASAHVAFGLARRDAPVHQSPGTTFKAAGCRGSR
jgi:hypothetical protein